MSELRFYLDENIPTEIARQLRRSGIDAVSALDLGQLGASDPSHLKRATEMGRILCTHDQDFLRLAAEGHEHAGIASALQASSTIGGWVRALRGLHTRLKVEEARNQVYFLRG